MPCNSDHMNPTHWEVESKKVAGYIWIFHGILEQDTPIWIQRASNNYYGDKERVHELTATLCALCKAYPVPKGPIQQWYEKHKKADEEKQK